MEKNAADEDLVSEDRRSFPRWSLGAPASLTDENGPSIVEMTIGDLSEAGIFLEGGAELPIDGRYRVRFLLPNGSEFYGWARIVRRSQDRLGYGASWDPLPWRQRRRLRACYSTSLPATGGEFAAAAAVTGANLLLWLPLCRVYGARVLACAALGLCLWALAEWRARGEGPKP